ncbi:biosynthesis protein [Nesidiocoris tenuis]|uniref:5-demethoxyubiquinone hydroxylase, mitochondrial n=1 Tax=Nesidiocoris tenuis TaxID=355587 RepID=A0ABN7AXD8_9HEMI|nr:biosynthesis protein [Nesidiocoris tenuis]
MLGGSKVLVTAVRTKHRACAQIAEMIRVDHAGEFGADRIYAGQMAVLAGSTSGPKIKEMWEQEKEHRAKFEELLYQRRVRPTFLLPIWHVGGFMLGAGSALLGEKGAMACTVAVESVIVDHYNDQLRVLSSSGEISKENQHLCDTIKKFRDDEQEHHDTGIKYGAMEAPFYDALTTVIKGICKVAIEISKKV